MPIRIIPLPELEALCATLDLATAAKPMGSTMDYQPIDEPLAEVLEAYGRAAKESWPAYFYVGDFLHSPVPESIRRFYPEERWEGGPERVEFMIHGLEAGGKAVLFLFGGFAGAEPFLELWGVRVGSRDLTPARELSESALGAIWHPEGALSQAIAAEQARAISESSEAGSSKGASARL